MNLRERASSKVSLLMFLKPFIGLGMLVSVGTMWYMLVEGWDWLDSLLMSVTTLTTVGFGFIRPLDYSGKVFTIVYILFGVILFLYLASEFAEYIIFMNFRELLSTRNMETKLKKIKEHFIICGYGRTGAEIVNQLSNSGLPFVIIDKEAISDNVGENFLFIKGDATDDAVLAKAGIDRAKGIFCSLSDDVDNLYLTLSSRNLNPNLSIVARCIKAVNEQKFRKAGANNIILPYEICGRRMVASVVKPLVVDFLDVVMHTSGEDLELKMEQFQLDEKSSLTGQTIISSELRQKTGVIIIAIKRGNDFITNPSPHTVLKENDTLISLGTSSQLSKFEELVY